MHTYTSNFFQSNPESQAFFAFEEKNDKKLTIQEVKIWIVKLFQEILKRQVALHEKGFDLRSLIFVDVTMDKQLFHFKLTRINHYKHDKLKQNCIPFYIHDSRIFVLSVCHQQQQKILSEKVLSNLNPILNTIQFCSCIEQVQKGPILCTPMYS
ncbi:MAG: hypothetical protein JWQ09_1000 [Segetibacter sp.]|nr:hypothetical protein [Segetibacter sp.]